MWYTGKHKKFKVYTHLFQNTLVDQTSQFCIKKKTPHTMYLDLAGELWGVYCENCDENYNGAALYKENYNSTYQSHSPGMEAAPSDYQKSCFRRCIPPFSLLHLFRTTYEENIFSILIYSRLPNLTQCCVHCLSLYPPLTQIPLYPSSK